MIPDPNTISCSWNPVQCSISVPYGPRCGKCYHISSKVEVVCCIATCCICSRTSPTPKGVIMNDMPTCEGSCYLGVRYVLCEKQHLESSRPPAPVWPPPGRTRASPPRPPRHPPRQAPRCRHREHRRSKVVWRGGGGGSLPQPRSGLRLSWGCHGKFFLQEDEFWGHW